MDKFLVYSKTDKKEKDNLSIISWNLNGIRSNVFNTAKTKKAVNVLGKDLSFSIALAEKNPDIICIQETKCTSKEGEELFAHILNKLGYKFRIWSEHDSKKGYAGVAIFSKIEFTILELEEVINYPGRVLGISVKFKNEDYNIFNFYVPNTGTEKAWSIRLDFNSKVLSLLNEMKKEKNILCGDFNAIKDLTLDTNCDEFAISYILSDKTLNKRNEKILPGCTKMEMEWIRDIEKMGYVDVFRNLKSDEKIFTCYSNIAKTYLRIDYFFTNFMDKFEIEIQDYSKLGPTSDHCYVYLKI